MTIREDVQKFAPGNLVTLYEIDLTVFGGDVQRYHAHNTNVIVWRGNEYFPWPIEAAEFERSGQGSQPNPALRIGNIGVDGEGNHIEGVVSALCLQFDDLVGAKITRIRTFEKYLDGQPGADPNQEFPREIWLIEQKTTETPETVSFLLASPLQFDNVQLPSREIVAGLCGWLWKGGYRGPYCGYTGSAMFDKNGDPVTDPTLDRCGGRLSDCKKRFGENEEIPYGGFPAADRTR